MINSFSQYLVEEEKTMYFTFGRMNPPTIGHEMLLNKLANAAGRNPYKIYLSKSSEPKKNPLSYNDKIKFARKMFPKHARQIIRDNKIKTVMDIATTLYNEGYTNIVMAVDGPRSREFDILLNKYNGEKGRHGFYNFKSIKFINVGERDSSSESIAGVSATKQRNAVKNNDFIAFTQGLPKTVSNRDARQLFNAVRKGMGLKEAKAFKNHIQLEPVSELREAYLRDNIFEEGEQVVMTKKGIVGKIKHLGTNYLIIESKGETWRCWLDDVSKVDPNFTPKWDIQDIPNDDNDGVIRESLNEATKVRWKRGKYPGDIEATIAGKKYKIEKALDHNDRHRGEWKVMVWDKRTDDWEWETTEYGKANAKDWIMNKHGLSESTNPHPEVVKAYKRTQDAEHKHVEYGTTATKRAVTRTANTLSKKINQHHPGLDMQGKIKIRTQLQNMHEESCKPEWGTPEATAKAKKMTPGQLENTAIDVAKKKIDSSEKRREMEHKRELARDRQKAQQILSRAKRATAAAKIRQTMK